MDWKESLDRYLTSPPDDGFDTWCEIVIEKHSNDFFNLAEDWIMEYAGQWNAWANKLFTSGVCPEEAAKIIERAYNIYLKK